MHSGARAMPASWTRSAIPGALPTRCRRRGDAVAVAFCNNKGRWSWVPAFRGDDERWLITARRVDDMLKRPAGLEAFDLARDVFRYFVGIGIGGVVRRQDNFWMRPERAVRGQRFI